MNNIIITPIYNGPKSNAPKTPVMIGKPRMR